MLSNHPNVLGGNSGGGGGGTSTFPNPPSDNTTTLGTSALRYSQIFVGPSGLKIGNGTSGPTITASTDTSAADLVFTPSTTGNLLLSGTTKLKFGNTAAISTRDGSNLNIFDGSSEVLLMQPSAAVFRVTGNYSIGFCAGLTSAAASDVGFTRVSAGVMRLSLAEGGSTTNGSLLAAAGTFSGIVTASGATATPAGGSTSARLLFGTTAGFGIYYGSGAPSVSAAQGSIYLRSDGSGISDRLYVNTNGSTTWTNFVTAA